MKPYENSQDYEQGLEDMFNIMKKYCNMGGYTDDNPTPGCWGDMQRICDCKYKLCKIAEVWDINNKK